MDSIKILHEKDNALFKRKEIVAEIHAEKVPSKEEASDLIAKKFSSDKQTVEIERIKGKFGSRVFSVSAKVYHSLKDKENTEPKPKKDKKGEAPKAE